MMMPNSSALPAGLSAPAGRALSQAGYTRIEQFTEVTEADVLKLHGTGPRTVETLRLGLAARGLSFAGWTVPTTPRPGRQGTGPGLTAICKTKASSVALKRR